MRLLQYISDHISHLFDVDIERFLDYSKVGDLELKIAFYLAKKEGRKPNEIAHDLKPILERTGLFDKVEIIKGYINLYLSDQVYRELIKQSPVFLKKKIRIIVEYPSVNPNKPWHIGHLRNALIGDSIANIYEYIGYDVQRIDYIDDLGLQVAQSYWYYNKTKANVEGKFDHFIGKQYVEVSSMFHEYEEEIRETLKQIEEGKINIRPFVMDVIRAQYETCKQYHINKDVMVFESDIMKTIFKKGIQLLKRNKAIIHETTGPNEGCWVVKINDKNMKNPDKVLIRSDGTATYTGKDVIFQLWKFGKLPNFKYIKAFDEIWMTNQDGSEKDYGNADIVVNVIGMEQTYPQQVIKVVLNKLGYKEESEKSIHLAYGLVKMKDEKLSGRKGTWKGYTADELLEEGIKRVKGKINDTEYAIKIALSAIKFSFLKISPSKELIFDWDRALTLEGDSGPYLLYSYVRASSIIKKSKYKGEIQNKDTFNKHERALILQLSKFNDYVIKSAKYYDPSILTNYLLETAKQFHSFYSNVRVIGTEEESKRIYIITHFKNILEKGLNLLGISTVDRM